MNFIDDICKEIELRLFIHDGLLFSGFALLETTFFYLFYTHQIDIPILKTLQIEQEANAGLLVQKVDGLLAGNAADITAMVLSNGFEAKTHQNLLKQLRDATDSANDEADLLENEYFALQEHISAMMMEKKRRQLEQKQKMEDGKRKKEEEHKKMEGKRKHPDELAESSADEGRLRSKKKPIVYSGFDHKRNSLNKTMDTDSDDSFWSDIINASQFVQIWHHFEWCRRPVVRPRVPSAAADDASSLLLPCSAGAMQRQSRRWVFPLGTNIRHVCFSTLHISRRSLAANTPPNRYKYKVLKFDHFRNMKVTKTLRTKRKAGRSACVVIPTERRTLRWWPVSRESVGYTPRKWPVIGCEGNSYPFGVLVEGTIVNSIELHRNKPNAWSSLRRAVVPKLFDTWTNLLFSGPSEHRGRRYSNSSPPPPSSSSCLSNFYRERFGFHSPEDYLSCDCPSLSLRWARNTFAGHLAPFEIQ
ncbi:hypothetical protein niasHT_035897 [Heterodera trifolii]|uniref:Uncharacterized protein n=1 Tax=Heterodera trifolii TaxID=157864 RepID=A0ABD2ILH7_9BILA